MQTLNYAPSASKSPVVWFMVEMPPLRGVVARVAQVKTTPKFLLGQGYLRAFFGERFICTSVGFRKGLANGLKRV